MKAILLASFLLLSQSPDQSNIQKQIHFFMMTGEMSMQNGHWSTAIDMYSRAIGTNMLSDLGMAVAYWNIYFAYANLENDDDSMNALLGFIVYGSSIVNDPYHKDAAEELMLKDKLSLSLAELQAKWASRNDYSCRSPEFACYITEESFIGSFEESVPFCGGKNNVMGAQMNQDGDTIEVIVHCTVDQETYYFTTKNEF